MRSVADSRTRARSMLWRRRRDHARVHGERSRGRRIAKVGAAARRKRNSARDQGPFETKDCAPPRREILGDFVRITSPRHPQLWREGRRHVGRAEQMTSRDGLVERDLRDSAVWSIHWRVRGPIPRGVAGGLIVVGSAGGGRSGMGATATETGGSIRQPAEFTETVGTSRPMGRCSRWASGVCFSLDQPGDADTREYAILMRSRWTGTIPRTPLDRSRCAGLRGIGNRQGHEDRHPQKSMPRRACQRNRKALDRGLGVDEDRGAKGKLRRGVGAAHPNTPCRRITSWRPGGLVQSGAIRTRALRPAICTAAARRGRGHPPPRRFWAEVAAASMIGTLCALAGYYDVLSARAEGSVPDQEGFRGFAFDKGFNAILGRPRTPSAASASGAEGADPVRCIGNGNLHGDGEHAGLAGSRSRWQRCAGLAARPWAADRPPSSMKKRRCSPRRGDRAGGGLYAARGGGELGGSSNEHVGGGGRSARHHSTRRLPALWWRQRVDGTGAQTRSDEPPAEAAWVHAYR